MRIFYAHPASAWPAQITSAVDLLAKAMSTKAGKPVRVRSGRADHKRNWSGNWEEWQYNVVMKKDATTGKAVYDAFVVSGEHIGRATANILMLALQNKRPVFWWNGQDPGEFQRVLSVVENDAEDWTGGWGVEYSRPDDRPKQIPLPFPEGAQT